MRVHLTSNAKYNINTKVISITGTIYTEFQFKLRHRNKLVYSVAASSTEIAFTILTHVMLHG